MGGLTSIEHNVKLILPFFLLYGLLYKKTIGQEIRGAHNNRSWIMAPMVNADPVIDMSSAPYMISLFEGKVDITNFHCGGTIISNTYVLTAGHCAEGFTGLQIRAGTVNFRNNGSDYKISDVIFHPSFDFPQYDIAILQVEKPIKFNENVQPISLPGKDFTEADRFSALALGYGTTQNDDEEVGELRYANVQVLSDKECDARNPDVNSEKLCTYIDENEVDTCLGDSGGPLVHEERIIGVLSYGPDPCATINTTAVYTKVSGYLDWIKEHTGV